MAFGFLEGRKIGIHFELAEFTVKRLREVNLLKKGSKEKDFELTVVSFLEASRKLNPYLITQVEDEAVEKISRASLFGYSHRPDVTIGKDGTAIEIKVLGRSTAVREMLGQAIAYRTQYRFVVLILVDNTDGRQIVELVKDKKSREYALLQGLADQFNVFTVIGPAGRNKNIIVLPRRGH